MNNPIMLTPRELVSVIMAVAAAIITLSGAGMVVMNIAKKLKEPEINQNARIARVEARLDDVDRKLAIDKERLDRIEYGHEVTQEAILALLNYQLNPDEKEGLKEAKKKLEQYLIARKEPYMHKKEDK